MKPVRATRLGRLADYLQEMYPPLVTVPATLASVAALWLSLHALDGVAPAHVGWRVIVGGFTVTLFSLLLRVYDELKDVETDLRLGRAGDPRYKDRAVVTGRVRVADIIALRNGVLIVLALINLPLGWPLPLAVFLPVLGLLHLSSRWFFAPVISRYLLLAFITHNPLSMAMSVYVVSIYVAERGHVPAGAWLVVVGFWLLTATWETSRKVRAPADETDYQTYSKVLGYRLAGVVPAVLAGLGVVLLSLLGERTGLGTWWPVTIGVTWAVLAAGCLAFVVKPSSRTSKLQPLAELLGLVVSLALPIALALRLGLTWR